jgi:hypothetical protein
VDIRGVRKMKTIGVLISVLNLMLVVEMISSGIVIWKAAAVGITVIILKWIWIDYRLKQMEENQGGEP